MIEHPAYRIEPWALTEDELDVNVLAQSESLFALSNGHIGWRGNLDEGEPHGLPGSYLDGVYESRQLPYAEGGYGYPEDGQTVINVTNGKIIRLLVDDHPFDVRYGELLKHVRSLDVRTGLLQREVEWTSPGGQGVRIRSTRLVSFAQRSIAAISYEVEPLDSSSIRIVLQSELVANEALPSGGKDPRESVALDHPLRSEENAHSGTRASLTHHTIVSGQHVAAAMDHELDGPPSTNAISESEADLARLTVTATIAPGERLRIVKYVAYGWSSTRSLPAVRDQVAAAMTAAIHTGWQGLVDAQRDYLDAFWARADIEIDGDAELQQSVRLAMFHVLQASTRAEERAIPAKGLSGPGYDGHAFWDTETYVLHMLTFTDPRAALHALKWRHSILPMARQRARQLGLDGAVFPWRTIAGAECSSYWPAGTAAFHVGADIADAVMRYIEVTDDQDFAREYGLELLAETARMWRSLGHHGVDGKFRIDGVTGPDEYSAIADNNVYTNLMAQHNLQSAADLAKRYPDIGRRFGIDDEETASWRDAAATMYVPYDEVLRVHPQADAFTSHEWWDFDGTRDDQYPLLLNFPYFDLYRKQVVKQADLVLAMHLRPDAFTADEKLRNFAYYEALTVRDSSLSAAIQAVMAAETGHLDLAYDYLGEVARVDLDDIQHNTRDGLHLAALAGLWIALVGGLACMRLRSGCVCFSPCLPDDITRLSVHLTVRGARIRLEITSATTVYTLEDGADPMTIEHDGEKLALAPGQPVSRPTRAAQPAENRPAQPRGRQPAKRHRIALG